MSTTARKLVLGGDDSPIGRGWYVRPTLFADATNDMAIAREEIFGPVLTVIKYPDERDAIRIANDSDYGLAGSVWTKDVAHGLEISGQIRTGTYGINMYMLDIASPVRRIQAIRDRTGVRRGGPGRVHRAAVGGQCRQAARIGRWLTVAGRPTVAVIGADRRHRTKADCRETRASSGRPASRWRRRVCRGRRSRGRR